MKIATTVLALNLSLVFSILSPICLANVTGEKTEVLGSQWRPSSFSHWASRSDALITPEISSLALQACFRDGQRSEDIAAYHVTKRLVGEMQKAFVERRTPTQPYDIGLNRLTQILSKLDSIVAVNAADYRRQCDKVMTETLRDGATRSQLLPLFRGRMEPKISAALPPKIFAKLDQMSRKGIHLAPLTWDDLVGNVCHLEGYYGTSPRAEHWKFFSLTRLMANVLPKEEEASLFTSAMESASTAIGLIRQLDTFSSTAGKYNGAVVGMSLAEKSQLGVRLTGPALGSRAPALMALFTTAWREGVQEYVIEQDYPEKPFALISARKVLSLVASPVVARLFPQSLSPTEMGMRLVSRSLLPWYGSEASRAEGNDYGETSQLYLETSGLAWLAMNAEANIRQNEKITGYERAASDLSDITTTVYGTHDQFASLVGEIDEALARYRGVDAAGAYTPECVGMLREFNAAAAEALAQGIGNQPRLIQLKSDDVRGLALVNIEPVIADIGLEVDDTVGHEAAGAFRLHLATGAGREVPIAIEGKSYMAWTPSAMVLHLDKTHTTTQWLLGEMNQYDKR